MKSSDIPVNVAQIAAWYVDRAAFETYDLEGAQHLIQALVASGAFDQAGAFVRKLLPAPSLFAPCAITLMETLCEFRYTNVARTFLPWFERRIRSKEHTFIPCDLYIAIAELADQDSDRKRAQEAIFKEPLLDRRAMRIIRASPWMQESSKHLQWVRQRIHARSQMDPMAAHPISYALTSTTKREDDFMMFCQITRAVGQCLRSDEYEPYLNQLLALGQQLPKRAVHQEIKRDWSEPITHHLQQAIAYGEICPDAAIVH